MRLKVLDATTLSLKRGSVGKTPGEGHGGEAVPQEGCAEVWGAPGGSSPQPCPPPGASNFFLRPSMPLSASTFFRQSPTSRLSWPRPPRLNHAPSAANHAPSPTLLVSHLP